MNHDNMIIVTIRDNYQYVALVNINHDSMIIVTIRDNYQSVAIVKLRYQMRAIKLNDAVFENATVLDFALVNMLSIDNFLTQVDDVTFRFAITNHSQCYTENFRSELVDRIILYSSNIASDVRTRVGSTSSSPSSLRSLFAIGHFVIQEYYRYLKERTPERSERDERSEIKPTTERSDGVLKTERSASEACREMIADEKPNVKRIRKRKEKPIGEYLTYDESDMLLAKRWVDYAKVKLSWITHKEDDFANHIAKVRRSTELNADGMEAVFEFIKSNSFWCDKASSPKNLLSKSKTNGLRKIDNILIQLKAKNLKADPFANRAERERYEPVEYNPFEDFYEDPFTELK